MEITSKSWYSEVVESENREPISRGDVKLNNSWYNDVVDADNRVNISNGVTAQFEKVFKKC